MRAGRILGTLAGLLLWALSGCSSGSTGGGGGNGSCPQISGNWTLAGCADTACSVSQSGCNVSLSCTPSGNSYTGTISGSNVNFGDSTTSCSGNVNGASATGTCSASGQSCTFSASCTGGACGSSGTGGGGGSGGGGGINCNQSCTALTACCPSLTMSSCLDGCNSNPNQPQSCLNCFNNTSCGNLAPCAIANCSLPADVCGAL